MLRTDPPLLTLRRGVYWLLHRRGFGVHSPFAYGMITLLLGSKGYRYYREEALIRFAQSAPQPIAQAHLRLCLLALRLAYHYGVAELRGDARFQELLNRFCKTVPLERDPLSCLTPTPPQGKTAITFNSILLNRDLPGIERPQEECTTSAKRPSAAVHPSGRQTLTSLCAPYTIVLLAGARALFPLPEHTVAFCLPEGLLLCTHPKLSRAQYKAYLA